MLDSVPPVLILQNTVRKKVLIAMKTVEKTANNVLYAATYVIAFAYASAILMRDSIRFFEPTILLMIAGAVLSGFVIASGRAWCGALMMLAAIGCISITSRVMALF